MQRADLFYHIAALCLNKDVLMRASTNFGDLSKGKHSSRVGIEAERFSPDAKIFESPRLVIEGPPIDNEQDYFTWLHEVGHIYTMGYERIAKNAAEHLARQLAGDASFRPDVTPELLQDEADAWNWAIDNSTVPMADEHWEHISFSLGTYAAEALRKEIDYRDTDFIQTLALAYAKGNEAGAAEYVEKPDSIALLVLLDSLKIAIGAAK